MSHPFNLSQGASSTEQVSAPVAPSPPAHGHSPRPKWQHPSPDLVDILPPSGTTSKATPEGPPSSKWQEIPPLHKVLTWATKKHSAWTPVWWGKWGRSTLKDISPTLLQRTPMIYQMSFGTWPRLLSYLAQPYMRLRRYGLGQTSCGKLTMHWGPCQRAWDSLEQYPHQSPQRLWAWWAYMIWMHCATSMGWPTALGVGRRAKMRAQLSTTSGQYIIGFSLVCDKCFSYPSTSSDTLCHYGWQNCQPSGEGVLMSHLHLHNPPAGGVGGQSILTGTWTEDLSETLAYLGLPIWG